MKKKIKRLIAWMCLAAMLLSSTTAFAYKAGTYEATADGFGGAMSVSVTINEDTISEIKVGDHNETHGIGTIAIDILPAQIVENQSLAVDTVAGATLSSEAILAAVADCVIQAGGDVEALKNKAIEVALSDEIIQLSTEVLVIGGGGCGLSAALEAAKQGAKVILLEKLALTGGSTALSAGVIVKNGMGEEGYNVDFTLDDLANYWKTVSGGKANEALSDKIASLSEETYDLLVDMGVTFTRTPSTVPTNPELAMYNAAEDPMMVSGNGIKLTGPMYDAVIAAGVDVHLSTPAKELVLDENGTVVGAKAVKSDGTTLDIKAQKVIIATGSFDQQDNEVKKMFMPNLLGMVSVSSVGNTGDGILMAVNAVNAATQFVAPACKGYVQTDTGKGLAGLPAKNALIINQKGERFVNESDFYANVLYAFVGSNTTYGYQIFDAHTVSGMAKMDEYVAAGGAYKADSLEELAKLINVPAETLNATIERYNELAGQTDADFNKSAEFMQGMKDAPFYAIGTVPCLNGSIGGLLINEKAQVLDVNGQPIKNLFAGGDVASTSLFYNKYPSSGSGVQFALASGRLAARSAVAELEK
jgi:succinate dehydrogenase/fumarate reductase flavoprotein subunit/uncharacterized protein with FMN-binding domain